MFSSLLKSSTFISPMALCIYWIVFFSPSIKGKRTPKKNSKCVKEPEEKDDSDVSNLEPIEESKGEEAKQGEPTEESTGEEAKQGNLPFYLNN